MSEITLTSTTDSPEAIQAALNVPAPAQPADAAQPAADEATVPQADAAATAAGDAATDVPGDQPGDDHDNEELSPQQRGAQTRNKTREYIERLRDERTRFEAQAQFERAERERIAQQLEALRTGAPRQAEAEPTPQSRPTDGEPHLEDFSAADDPYAEYVKALAKFQAQQIVAQQLAEREAQRQVEAQQTTLRQRIQSFAAEHPDYEQVVTNPELRINDAMQMVLRESEDGPALAYHLGQNPAECARIAALPAHQSLVELGMLRARMSAGTSAPAPRVTNAPPPPTPVRGASTATSIRPDEMDYQTFKAWRSRRLAGKG